METPVHYRLLGVDVTPLDKTELQEVIAGAAEDGRRCIVANHNLHSVYLFQRDPKLRKFYSLAKLAQIDGMPLVLFGRLLGHPISREQRVTNIDIIRPLMARAERSGWRVFFVGGRPGVGERAAAILRDDFPGLDIKAHHGYFDHRPESAENRDVVSLINGFRPHLLMVGMGMPVQEHWVVDNIDRLEANAVLQVGALMDLVGGALRTPPRWMGRAGLEWLFRLVSEPKRVWRRYLVEPWPIAWLMVKELASRHVRGSAGGSGGAG